jgi:signal transduction histidine kinase
VLNRNLDRMETMIDEILTITRADESLEATESVQLGAVIDDAWETTGTDKCSIDNDIPAGETVEANRSLLLQVFENLFQNAIEHNEGPVDIHVGTLVGDGDDPDTISLYVEDSGSGIPPSDLEDIFGYGFTTDRAGTGYGLAIARDIIAAHDGEIQVTAADDGGARFEITDLPVGD